MYLFMFYTKIPNPWGSALIRDYPFVSSDTLGRRISFLKEKLSQWCDQTYLIKKAKTLRRKNVICCKGNDLITVIGDSKKTYKKRNNFRHSRRFNKRFNPRKYFVKRKPTILKRKPWINKKRTIYRRNPIKAKECRCYSCNQIGHYSNECPNRFTNKKVELDDDIERMIIQEGFIKINRFEDLDEIH